MSLLSPSLVPLLTILGLLLLGPGFVNLLVKFLSSRIESIKLQMALVQGVQPFPERDSHHLQPLG